MGTSLRKYQVRSLSGGFDIVRFDDSVNRSDYSEMLWDDHSEAVKVADDLQSGKVLDSSYRWLPNGNG